MCYIDLEYAEIWSETEHTARTRKFCSSCDGEIKPGERYIKHFSKYDGNITSNRLCLACEKDRAEFADAHDGMSPTPDNFYNMLSECISEDDEGDRWRPMLESMKARRAFSGEVATQS